MKWGAAWFYVCLISLLPVGLFYGVVGEMAVNVPYQDDFDGLLEPVLNLSHKNAGFSEFWGELYRQDDERRLVVDRLVAVGLYFFTGTLNLKHMIWLGVLTLLVLTEVIRRTFVRQRWSPFLFLPVPWLVFNIQFYETVFWPMIPLQHLAVFVWTFTALWMLEKRSRIWFAGAVFCAVVAIYSDVSGNFVLLAGSFLLVLQRRWSYLLPWIGLTGIVVFFYFYGLKVPEYRPGLTDSFSQPVLLGRVLISLFGLWADPGPTFLWGIREGVALIAGFLTIGVLWNAVWKRAAMLRDNGKLPGGSEAFVWAAVGFITTVFVVLALGRATEGVHSFFNPRYRHMYVFCLVFVFLLNLHIYPDWFKKKQSKVWLLSFALVYWGNAMIQYWGPLDRFRKVLLSDGYEWYHNRALPSSPIYLALKDRVDDIYEGVYDKDIYRGEAYPFAGLPMAEMRGKVSIEVMERPDAVAVSIPGFARGYGKDEGAYVILRGEGEVHVLPAFHTTRPLHRILTEGRYYYEGAQTEWLVKRYLKSPVLEVEIGVIDGTGSYRLSTGEQVHL